MGSSIGIAFPNNCNPGHVHNIPNEGVYQYLGGDPKSFANWSVIGGMFPTNPDVTGWDARQRGAQWFNRTENAFFGWDGVQIVALNSSVIVEGTIGSKAYCVPADGFALTVGGNVFPDFQTAFNALSQDEDVDKELVLLGDATTRDFTVGAQTYNFGSNTKIKWIGHPNTRARMNCGTGVLITNLQFLYGVEVRNVGTDPFIMQWGSRNVIELVNGALGGTGNPVIQPPSLPAFVSLSMHFNSQLLIASIANLDDSLVFVNMFGPNAAIRADSLNGSGGADVRIFTNGPENILELEQANYSGSLSVELLPQQAGDSGNRPTGNQPAGFMYFDTGLGRPIFADGSGGYVNADGTAVT